MGNKYLKLSNYPRGALNFANQHLFKYLEIADIDNKTTLSEHPPIFILGAPRSGSTLVFQVLTEALDVGYISNLHCQWFGAPSLAEYLFHPTVERLPSDYRSVHGRTSGQYAPSECGAWWYRFFRRTPPYMTMEDVDPVKMAQFRRSVIALTSAFNKPILFKNLYASLRIQPISSYLPESLFVIICRNEVDNGHSLLEARYRSFGSYDPWFSVEPPEIDRLKTLPPYQQVIDQIRQIHKIIDKDFSLSSVPPNRCFKIVYEDFCDNPRKNIDDFNEFLAINGCHVKLGNDVPDFFERREEVRIDYDAYNKMLLYVNANE